MKKIILSFALVSACSLSAPADIIYPDGHEPYQMTEPYEIKKIGRGLANIVTAPIEIPRSVFDISHEEGVESPQAFTLGPLRGIVRMGERAASGVRDVFYWHEGNEKPLRHLQPETLSMTDILPTYRWQFHWETIDTAAPTDTSIESPSWH